jgi:predicted nucleic acid-binding protein
MSVSLSAKRGDVQSYPRRVFLDTNVYIVGAALQNSPEAALLDWAGFGSQPGADVVILVSDALFQQVSRVAQRLRHKDWAGEIIGRIWRGMTVDYVLLDDSEISRVAAEGSIPREDITVYLTALRGHADCFVSANHELVQALARQTGAFDCLTAASFVETYLRSPVQE